MNAKYGRILLAAVILTLAALACGPSSLPTPTPMPTAPQTGDASPTPTLMPPPEATDTPVPDVSGPGGCALNGAYVADVTVPDDTVFSPGTPFVKTWRVRNSGTCDWEAGTKVAFVSGDPMGGPADIPVGAVAAGATADVNVNLTAPPTPGTYRGNWQLQAPDTTRYGSVIYVQIIVPAPATDTPEPTEEPTATPTEEPTPGPTNTPIPPDLRVTGLSFTPDVLVKNSPFHVLATLHNDGPGALSNVKVQVEDHFPHPHASCTNMDMVNILHQTTVNLNDGQSLPVDYTVQTDTAWEHIICVKIDPDDATVESDEDNNYQGQSVLVGTLTTIPLDTARSGSIKEDGDILSLPQPGDSSDNQRVKGYLSWNLTSLPTGAQILDASVDWNTHCFHGGNIGGCTGDRDPFTPLGGLYIYAYYYGNLNASDFANSESDFGNYVIAYGVQPTGYAEVTEEVADALAAGHLQLHIRFHGAATDSDGFFDGVRFEEDAGDNVLTVVHMP